MHDQAGQHLDLLNGSIHRDYPGLLVTHPVDSYISDLDRAPPYASYRFVHDAAAHTCQSIVERWGREGLEHFHRAVLSRLIAGISDSIFWQSYPSSIKVCCEYTIRRILGVVIAGRSGFFKHSNDLFAKDLAVCRGKLIPCGAELVDPRAGMPRRLLFRQGLRQFARGALCLFHRMKAFRPLYETHWDRRLVAEFNATGYHELYLRIAELLLMNPDMKGLMTSGWWFDPALESISPELKFVGDIPLAHGACLLYVGDEGTTVQDALWLSPRRTALYRAGRYRPASYVLLWSRNDILAWHAAAKLLC